MKYWILNLMQTIIAALLFLITGYLFFAIGSNLAILLGALCLIVAVIIQTYVFQSIYTRDKWILTELKDYENILERTRDEIKEIPHFLETNNSKIADFINTSNSDICRYIDNKILELKKFIERQNNK